MKSQLLQSCQGCVPSTISPILTFPKGKEKSKNKDSIPAFFMKRSVTTTSSNTVRMNSRPLGRVREGFLISYFFTAKGGLFFTAFGRFLNHAGCCRHAKHGVGGGGDDKEENSFSDWRHHLPQKGEADNSHHGFLCLYQPLTKVAINGLIPQLTLPQAAATLTELRFPSPGLRAKHATLGSCPTNLATLTELRLAVGVTRSVFFHVP